jgi:hypothetical protein
LKCGPYAALRLVYVSLSGGVPCQHMMVCITHICRDISQLVSACLTVSQFVSCCLSLSHVVSACLSVSQFVSVCLG